MRKASKQDRRFLMLVLGTALLGVGISISSAHAADAKADQLFDETKVTTLFAFDQVAIPFTENLKIEMRQPEKLAANPVVQRGPKGSPDSWAVQFYGSVIKVDDEYRMWYAAAGDDRFKGNDGKGKYPWSVAYAVSKDGVNWTKPNLGLVEYNGNPDNNLVNFGDDRFGILNVKVLHEPEAAPDQQYKMSGHIYYSKGDKGRQNGTLGLFFSSDGLNWKSATDATPVNFLLTDEDLVLPRTHHEPCGGLYKWNGLYYTSGQNAVVAARPYHGRVVRSFVSGDFVDWQPASAVGFVRPQQHTLLGPGKSRDGEQTHEGVSVWNRGNVLLGVGGIWHGATDWSGVTIDLSFVMSNDGVTFREPAHEWVFIKRGEDGEWDQGGLLQGQGFENVGDQTYVYYGAWDPRGWKDSPPRGGVGIVTVPRDRFGAYVVDESAFGDGEYQVPFPDASFLTAAIPLKGKSAQTFYMNVDGLSAEAALKVELLGPDLKAIPGFSGDAAALVRENGFQTPVSWNGVTKVPALPEHIHIRVTYQGKRQADIRFSALYVRNATAG